MNRKKYLSLPWPNLPNTYDLLTDEIINNTGRNYIIKMHYNENKFGCSPNVRNNIGVWSPNIYPEYGPGKLSEYLSELSGISYDNTFFSNGSDAILDHIPKIFGILKEKPNIIIPSLTYGRIGISCSIFNFKINKVDLVDYKINLDKMLAAIDANTTIVYIVNPNMPTGTFNKFNSIVEFLQKVPKDIVVVIDEAYIEYAIGIDEAYRNDKYIIENFDNVIITRTFSKLYGIASFRIGYCFSSKENIEIMKKTHCYLPIAKYSYQAANAAIRDREHYDNILTKTKHEKNFVYDALDKLNVKYVESYGNYIFILSSLSNIDNKKLENYLLNKHGLLIRCIDTRYIRLTLGCHKENEIFITGLSEFLCLK